MMNVTWPRLARLCKPLLILALCLPGLNACSTNPATGKSQFTALMSPQEENNVGAAEHEKIIQQFGLYKDEALQNYVREVGRRVTQNTERPDVQYKFFVLDSPIVNAFALPGGYIYVSRGLLALADNEAELAAVLSHEAGHITGRHTAERYSQSVITSLGAAVISAAVDRSGVSQALDLGGNLYLSSYSRGQENEADTLGLRYMSRGGYDPLAMSSFLDSLKEETALTNRLQGRGNQPGLSYFSTHPATEERVAKTSGEAGQYPPGGTVNRDSYLQKINGLVYGDSASQGFIRGQSFLHPDLGFGFEVPPGFNLVNQPTQVVASSASTNSVIVFDMVSAQGQADPMNYLTKTWLKGEPVSNPESITVNGMAAATGAFPGAVNGTPMTIQLMAIEWSENNFARFQVGIPKNASQDLLSALKSSTYSFHRLTPQEKSGLRPYRINIVTAKAGDSIASLARRQPFPQFQEERFRLLNELKPGQNIQPGQKYKLIAQ